MTLLPFEDDPRKPIYTRSGWEIPQLEFSELIEQSRWQSAFFVRNRTDSLLRTLERKEKKIIAIRSSSAFMYNCVGMIFASRRAWIETIHPGQSHQNHFGAILRQKEELPHVKR